MIVISDFCRTIVPFNTTYEFLKFIYCHNFIYRLIWFGIRILSKFGFSIEESTQIYLIKKFNPRMYELGKVFISAKIDQEYNSKVVNKILEYKNRGAFVVINSATFDDFFLNSKLVLLADKILASNKNFKNSGEKKIQSLIVSGLMNDKNRILFSDSISEDFSLFISCEIKYYVNNGEIFSL